MRERTPRSPGDEGTRAGSKHGTSRSRAPRRAAPSVPAGDSVGAAETGPVGEVASAPVAGVAGLDGGGSQSGVRKRSPP